MEEVLSRFPSVGQHILKHLDDKDLVKCKMVSETWCNFLDNSSLLYKRRINKYAPNQVKFKKFLKLITEKVSVETLKNLAANVEEYFRSCPDELENQISPHEIIASEGLLIRYKYIVEQTQALNPLITMEELTPLHFAANMGYFDIVKYITSHLEEKNPPNVDGWTPLHGAAQRGHLEIVKYIAGQLENKNPPNNNGWTPLHEAASKGQLEIVKYIAGQLENKNPANNEGNTPIHFAAKNGHFEIFQIHSRLFR